MVPETRERIVHMGNKTFVEECEELHKQFKKLGRAMLDLKEGETLSYKQFLLRVLRMYWPLIIVWIGFVFMAFIFR